METISKQLLIILTTAVIFLPAISFANGGDQRVLGNEYLINLARSPFTPTAGIKTAMTVSFVDLKTGRLIQEDILATIRIGEGRGSKTFIHEEKNLIVTGGILEWSYIFAEPGIHEIFFNFAFVSNLQKIYESPDFLLDVQKSEVPVKDSPSILIGIVSALIGCIIGVVIGALSNKRPIKI